MATSLQDRFKQRRSSTFIGREQQLEMFRQNIIRPLDSEDCYFIFSIHGQGGVGKTELLKKYNAIAREHKALAANIDEDTKDLPEMLADFARQLKEQNAPLNEFDERYKIYLQEKKRLEADPEAPKGAWNFGARFLTRTTKSLAKELVPGAGLVMEHIDADALGDQLGEWAAFVAKKLTNKDEVQLLIEPVETLTPLFLKGLGKYAKHPRICLFFDTFEETGRFADAWLRHLLNGKYGDAPENLMLVVAGRDPLDPNLWSNFGDFITTVALEEFSEIEAKTYLERKNITSPAIVETILELSGRLPVLLATLAEAAPDSPDEVSDPNATAVSRFLKWINDPVQRRLALHAALPRRLNQDIIQCLLPEGADAESFFNWLCSQPFVKKQKGGYWSYHSIVRDLMQRYQFQLSPATWSTLHSQLAAYYEKRAADLGIEGREKCFQHEEWLSFRLESGFHRLSAAYTKELPNAIADWVTTFRLMGIGKAIPCAENVVQAGTICNSPEIGNLLRTGSAAILADDSAAALPLISKISGDIQLQFLEDSAFISTLEGGLLSINGDQSKAIICVEKAIEIKPSNDTAWLIMGNAYSSLGQKEKAIECYQKAIEIRPDYDAAWNNMGNANSHLGQQEKAIECYQKAIEIEPDKHEARNNMGNAYSHLGQKEKAIECYQKAIEIRPDYDAAWNNMGNAYSALGQKEKAIECYQKAIEIKPDYYDAWNNMGSASYELGQTGKAIECYQKAIDIKPDDYAAWYNMGIACSSLGQQEKAIECYQKAIEIKPDKHGAWNNMGSAYDDLGQKEKAIECYQKSIDIKPDDDAAWYNMGIAYSSLGLQEKAIECYQKAIEIKPDKHEAWYNMGIAYSALGQKEKAIEFYQKAIGIRPDKHENWGNMGNAYASLGQQEKAIECYQKVIEIKSDDDKGWNNMGRAHLLLHHLPEAETALLKAWELSGHKSGNAHMNLGHLCLLRGEREQALNWYRQSLPLWKDQEKFFTGMASEYEELQMAGQGISREAYAEMLEGLLEGN